MLKKTLLFLVFLFLFFNFSACTLTEPGMEKNLPSASNDEKVNIDNPDQIQINKEKDSESLETEENNNLIIPKENMTDNNQENQEVAATQATISTNKGDIIIKLEAKKAPNTVKNFVSKATQGFYNNLTFHRVEDWVIQGGDPVGNGTGGGKMPTEINDLPFIAGSVGVARGGDIAWSNDSQFFICSTDCNWLNKQYTNFGQVTEGMDVVKQIEIGDTILSIATE